MGRAIRETLKPNPRLIPKVQRKFKLTTAHMMRTHTKRGSYGPASHLLLTSITNARSDMHRIWQPFLDALRQQQPAQSLSSYIDAMHTMTPYELPRLCMFERIYLEVLELGSMRRAHEIMTVFIQEDGSGSAMAHGLYGLLTVCLREEELGGRTKVKADLERVSGCLPLVKEDMWNSTRFGLMDAESHLFRALQIDPDCDFFKPAYIQVLLALGKQEDAEEFANEWLASDQSLPARRAVMDMGEVELESVLEYIQTDPFALSADRFSEVIEQALGEPERVDRKVLGKMLRVVIEAIDVGNSQDKFAWKCLAKLLAHFSATDPVERDRAMDNVWGCWMSTYLSPHMFVFDKKPSHLQVYKAVCLKFISDLYPDHPAQLLLDNSLSAKQRKFTRRLLKKL